ncbi:MAG TPA: hypothetical protein VFG58_00055 [Solirubrobacterales bacterium]|nr:hypothetical protein [Solirubrobacterales bacterium]
MSQASSNREIPWLRWMLLGCIGWIALMLTVGSTIGLLATPAAGPILGWLLGGLQYLLVGVLTRR